MHEIPLCSCKIAVSFSCCIPFGTYCMTFVCHRHERLCCLHVSLDEQYLQQDEMCHMCMFQVGQCQTYLVQEV